MLVLLWCFVGGCVELVGLWACGWVCCRLGPVLLVSWRVSLALPVSCSCCSCPARISMRISMHVGVVWVLPGCVGVQCLCVFVCVCVCVCAWSCVVFLCLAAHVVVGALRGVGGWLPA